MYDIPRRDKLAVKTSSSNLQEDSSSDEDSGAIYAVPRPSLSDEQDDIINTEQKNYKTPERNGISPNSVNEMAVKGRSSSPHIQNGYAEKQPPLTPRKPIVKSESDHIIAAPRNRGEKQ